MNIFRFTEDMNEAQTEEDISKYMPFLSNTSYSKIYKLLN
jgi:hypothetical protein